MPRTRAPLWPVGPRSVFFSNAASRPTLAAAVRHERIRRLAPGIWSADLDSAPAEIIAANIWEIVARILPDAVIVDRSAASGGRIDGGIVTVATDARAGDVALPGITVVVRSLVRHETDNPWTHGLTTSAPARTIVDNLGLSRGRTHGSRTLSVGELQDWVASKALTWGPERLERLRSEARALAHEWGLVERVAAIDVLFDEAEGRRPLRTGRGGAYARAVAAGTAWDEERVARFAAAAQRLRTVESEFLAAPVPDGELPFFEAYFSNFIEGTEFTVEDARVIVETNTPPARRPAEGHDILGTYHCVVDPIGRAQISDDPAELIDLLRARHRTLMGGRPEIGPGEFKDQNNRVGSVDFVDHQLVAGTLTRGLQGLARLVDPFARALYVMFVVAEVHPFVDGNGRAARLMMNAELSHVGACRIVVPTVMRNEYVSAMRRATVGGGDTDALVAVLSHAWRWSAAMPWADRAATDGQMQATNALVDSTEAAERHVHLELP